MARIMRISSMQENLPCVVMVNDQTKHFPVHRNKNDNKFINIGGKRMTEKDLPMGEEIII